ncbi:hypothetical protein Slin15195_G067380 [Septoria linicola]|uniref:Uncharacterized protein n=1 Tax=Septoria linicola TaxID=215465 RepID=A0A9Q9AQ66_9PEZI|nr:hypothetical protein Slin15195_G067380 [Septoria linicola]
MAITRSQAAGGKKPTPIKKAKPSRRSTLASPKNFICPPAPPSSPQPKYKPQAKVKKSLQTILYRNFPWPVRYKTNKDFITAIIVAPLAVRGDLKAGVKELVTNLSFKDWYKPEK